MYLNGGTVRLSSQSRRVAFWTAKATTSIFKVSLVKCVECVKCCKCVVLLESCLLGPLVPCLSKHCLPPGRVWTLELPGQRLLLASLRVFILCGIP